MKFNLEKDFEKALHEAAIKEGFHVVPLPDDCKVGFASGAQKASEASQKPYDFGLCVDGEYVAIECKLVKTQSLVSLKIKKHQYEGLESAYRAGALPLLAVYYKFKRDGKIYEEGFLIDLSYRFARPCFTYENLGAFDYDFVKSASYWTLNYESSILPVGFANTGLTVRRVRDILNERRKLKC